MSLSSRLLGFEREEHLLSDRLPDFLDRSRIVSVRQAAALLNLSIPHLRRLYRTGKFPKPFTVGERKLGWTAGEFVDAIDAAHRGST